MKRRLLTLLLALASMPALADISLPGDQHIGDAQSGTFTPRDPVTRKQMQSDPVHFNLSQSTTVTAVRLDGLLNPDNKLQVFIDNMSTPLAGTLSGGAYTLATPLTLATGSHTIWPDGGCSNGGFKIPCKGGESDFGFSGITLISAQTNKNRGDHRRRHLGDTGESNNDYYGGRWYPDQVDASAVNISFSVDVSRLLSEVRFWRLRDVGKSPQSFARVLLDGVQIGTLTGNLSPYILSSSAVLGVGTHTLRVETGSSAVSDKNDPGADDISWDDTILILTDNPTPTPGAFNAVERNDPLVASGQILTRTAGSAIDLDIVALGVGGALLTTYAGSVTVDLLDARNTTGVPAASGANCDAGWVSLGTVAAANFLATDGGRRPISFSYPDVLRDVRLRLTDGTVTSCSTDNFAIKPDHFGNILVSHDNATTAGTTSSLATSGFTASTTPIHHAGQPFTIRVTAYNALGAATPGYAGSPTLSVVSDQLGTNAGVASAFSWIASGGTVRSDNVTYSEAGAARIELRDTTFAKVDTGDTTATNRQIGPVAFDVGRFVPDHFRFKQLVAAQFVPACSGGSTPFTYVGQPFVFASTPSARITAAAADGTTTANYDGALYKILVTSGALAPSTYAALGQPSFDLAQVPNPDNSFVNQGNGVSLYTVIPPVSGYRFTRATPVIPFDADITISLNLNETDVVDFDPATPGRFGTPAADQGIPFAVAGVSDPAYNQMRYGRLVIENTHGSERLPLQVPVRAEYFETVAGGTGFARNLLDNGSLSAGCTGALLTIGTFSLTGTPGSPAAITSGLTPMDKGLALLTLNAPNVTEQDTITAQIAGSLPWLQIDDNDADLLWNNNPTGVAAFGLFKNDERRIYQREVIGP